MRDFGGVTSLILSSSYSPMGLTWAISSKQLKMYFLASFDLIPVSASWSSGVWSKEAKAEWSCELFPGPVTQTLELLPLMEGPFPSFRGHSDSS